MSTAMVIIALIAAFVVLAVFAPAAIESFCAILLGVGMLVFFIRLFAD